jgi:photosystem II stability/assembly factor-like uncharacterized protein
LFGVHFATVSDGLAVGLDGEIWRTTDGGANWTPVESPATRAIYSVAVHGRVGWIAGDSGTVLVSNDAGATWRRVPVPEDLKLFWMHGVSLVAEPDGPTGIITGAHGLMLWTDGDRIRPQ